MSNKTQFETLFAYHFETTLHLVSFSRELADADLDEDPEYGRGSIKTLFVHLLSADRGWRIGLETAQQARTFYPYQTFDLDQLQTEFEAESTAYAEFLAGLDDEILAADIDLTTLRTFPRWRILQHLLLHGMQHHAELAQLLTEKGNSPGDLDFIFYC